jgi:hypothetical protein
LGGGLWGLCCGVGADTTGTSSTARCTDEASKPMPTEAGECGVGVVAGAWQEQAVAEHEPACGRGGCGRGRGVCACERAQRVGVCVMAGRARAPVQQRGEAGGAGSRRGLCGHASVLRRGGD